MLNFKLDSFKSRATNLQPQTHQREENTLMINSFESGADSQPETHQREENTLVINSRKSINNLEKELSFLNPEIFLCEEIFEKGLDKNEFEHIWSELRSYNLILSTVKSEVAAKNLTRRCMEGHSYKYAEEGYMMAKLAR